ncbi:MAG: ABC transporter substrate-binding protein [Sulfolobales archaeon]
MRSRDLILVTILVIVALLAGILVGPYLGATQSPQYTTLYTPIYRTQIVTETRTEIVTTPLYQVQTTTIVQTYVSEWPLRITDALGREVVIDKPPTRIVSTAPSITEILGFLGLVDKIVGVDSYSNYPPEVLELVKAGRIAVVGGPWTLDVEKIIGLKPDIVFMCRGVTPQETSFAPKLESVGVKTFFLRCDLARDQYDLYEDIRAIGIIAGVRDAAANLIERIQANISSVQAKIASANASRVRVLILIGPPTWGLWTGGGDTFMGWLIRTAGGSNIADRFRGWVQLSYEDVLQADPQVIIVLAHGSAETVNDIKNSLANSPITRTTAWKNGDVYVITGVVADTFQRPSPRLVDALNILAKILHPEIFGRFESADVIKILLIARIILVGVV